MNTTFATAPVITRPVWHDNPDLMIGKWVTRSVSHSMEHKVTGVYGDEFNTRCGQRIRIGLAQPAKECAGSDLFQCPGCAH